mmetsp:Transcript_5685/g.15974  ORF Transcript_5685/g.15974 Transcript_5685/m.15974 type:complete len:910 (-) Transcript_5685:332-3061(-)|eukprot:CAMPEP_0181044522 /NCGR_PEP_ID=MMETSP1070-20121207/13311_1 /TAXON_ID=265543 /ORGANISM="Minutocellus polymorphus, Strain NH13" /LENGTH=909 /DNA_ID=CAMNT_0023122973 /DNA_START=537 /DNA_END=3266 /DNA_ORIENTATION=+
MTSALDQSKQTATSQEEGMSSLALSLAAVNMDGGGTGSGTTDRAPGGSNGPKGYDWKGRPNGFSSFSDNLAGGRPTTPEQQRTRNESIDRFLSQSPSQTLGNDLLNFGQETQATNQGGLNSSYGFMSQQSSSSQIGRRDISPNGSITGTSASTGSRSQSPSQVQSHLPGQALRGSMSSSAFDHDIGLAGRRNMSHASLASTDETFDSRHHRMQTNQPGSNKVTGGPYPSTAASAPRVDEHFTMMDTQSQQTSAVPMLFPVQQNPLQNGNFQNSIPGGSAPPPQQQQQQQVFYMAVATADGRQVLQPVQVVQIPGQAQPAVVLAPGMPGMALNAGQVSQHPQVMPPQAMIASAGGHVDMSSPSGSKKYDPRRSKPNHHPGVQRIGSSSSSSKANLPYGQRGRGDDTDFAYEGGYDNSRSYARDVSPSGASPYSNDQMSYSRRPTPTNSRGPSPRSSPTPSDVIATLYAAPQRPPLDELLGNVRRLSRDQVGCRLLQQALDEEGPMAATMILEEGLSFWGEAMVDPFGNYLFQKILEKITPSERVVLVRSVSARLVNASLNLHGTRSVQKVVELCASDEPIMAAKYKERQSSSEPTDPAETAASILTRSLTPAAARLCIDSHGNHVIQRILLKLPQKHSHFVFEAVAASVGDVARHRHGCCVIQRCLDSPPSDARSRLVDRIVEKALELMQDAYGNYVVQYVLDVCGDKDVHVVCDSVVGRVNSLAIQKFSSNVVEKCLERCTDKVREQYLDELSDPDRIRELMMDPFGNYVIQRALSVATHAQATRLVDAIRPHLLSSQQGGQSCAGLRNTAGGRRILAKICRRFPNFNLDPVGEIPQQMYQVAHNKHVYARQGDVHSHHMHNAMQMNPPNMGISPSKRRSFHGNSPVGSYRGGVGMPGGYHSYHQSHNI